LLKLAVSIVQKRKEEKEEKRKRKGTRFIPSKYLLQPNDG
jgi:hypothetical protein